MRFKLQQAQNWLYFNRQRVVLNTLAFCGYSKLCWEARNWQNETARMGVAGSIAHGTVEAIFHFIDTVNIKSKATETESTSTMTMVRKIWANEGVVGFGRGIGAAIYGNYTAGFFYFVVYKWLKTNMP